jgi:microcystin-dependent protein
MSSTYSPILRSELIGAGDQAGTWGSTTNSNFQYIFESAIAGYVAVTVSPTSNNQVLTYVNGPSASAALDQSVYAILKLNAGTLGANFNIFAPPVSKTYVIWNNTAYTATFYNSTVIGNTTAGGSGAVIPAGAKVIIWSDGTSFYGNDTAVGNFNVAGNLTVTGTTTFTGIPSGPTAAAGTNTTQLATTAFVAQNAVLTGALLMWPTSTAPSGYLLCTGTAVSRTTYAALFAIIGTTFGAGDGSTTFNLPNYTNRFPYGTTVGATGGSADAIVVSHTHTAGSSSSVSDPGHNHGVADPGHAHNIAVSNSAGGSGPWSVLTNPTYLAGTNAATTGIGIIANTTGIGVSTSTTVNATGASGTNANLPPYLGINFIIKT